SDELLEKLDYLISRGHEPQRLKHLYQREMEKRLKQARKDGKKPEVSLNVFVEIMRLTEIQILQNMMTHRIEIKSEGFSNIEVIGLAEEQKYLGIREILRKFNFPANLALEYIKLSVTPYHPVIDWIMEKPVDGINRFDDLYNTLNCTNENQELAKQFLWKWSLQAVRAAMGEKGQASELVLILKGKQAAGKTMWFRSLAPDDFVKTGLQLNPSNKDSILEANTAWINELGEFDGMTRKVDHANLKAFLSKTDDYVRRPYAVVEERIPRKSVFGATVNTESFLVDDTGNRRYLVLEVDNVNHSHNIDMQLYWRQVWERAKRNKNHEPHWLSAEELTQQQEQSEKYRMLDPIIQSFQKNQHLLTQDEYWVKDIIQETSFIDEGRITAHQCKIMKQHLIGEGWTTRTAGQNRYWLVKPQDEGIKVKDDEPTPF
ncbi:virulence-associated E family protein, partial [Gammaproteobacteria bacterium]|nr:virulence-associated E family protein [Gammaproteobacteria bacterium]